MNETKQNALIAEEMGTHFIQRMSDRWIIRDRSGAEMECVFQNGITQSSHPMNFEFLEDFTKDLNAMHEAEDTLGWPRTSLMRNYLEEICERSGKSGSSVDFSRVTPFWMATAKQRAEAFLRTTGKWEEES